MLQEKITYESRTIINEGREIDLMRWGKNQPWKIHNWDKPAIRSAEGRGGKEYYLWGIRYSEEEFAEALKDRDGLPWYKTTSTKQTNRF